MCYIKTPIAKLYKKFLAKRPFTKQTKEELFFNLNGFFYYLEKKKGIISPEQIKQYHFDDYASLAAVPFPNRNTLEAFLILNNIITALMVFCCIMQSEKIFDYDYSKNLNFVELINGEI